MKLNLRHCVLGTLWGGAVLLLLLVISLALWCVLAAVGDLAGATVARVLAMLVGVCWGLDLLTLVVLVAFGQIATEEGRNLLNEQE